MQKIDSAQLCKEINQELIDGLAWNPTRPVVAMFGSARLKPDSKPYQDTVILAGRLAKKGWTVLTGGGPGIMEAGNKGAFEAGGESVGLNIVLAHEQFGNSYQTVSLKFNHFTARKAVFVRRTDVFIAFEGGFGTLDEIFDTVTQIQTGKRPPTTIMLMGKDFWTPLMDWIGTTLVQRKVISPKDVDLFKVVDTLDQAEYEITKAWLTQNHNAPSYVEANETDKIT